MKKLLFAAIFSLPLLLFFATPAMGDNCTAPPGQLAVPHFAVDTSTLSGVTGLFTAQNASDAPLLLSVNFWNLDGEWAGRRTYSMPANGMASGNLRDPLLGIGGTGICDTSPEDLLAGMNVLPGDLVVGSLTLDALDGCAVGIVGDELVLHPPGSPEYEAVVVPGGLAGGDAFRVRPGEAFAASTRLVDQLAAGEHRMFTATSAGPFDGTQVYIYSPGAGDRDRLHITGVDESGDHVRTLFSLVGGVPQGPLVVLSADDLFEDDFVGQLHVDCPSPCAVSGTLQASGRYQVSLQVAPPACDP